MKRTVSILLIGYESNEKLLNDIIQVTRQTILADFEYIISDPFKKLNIDVILNNLNEIEKVKYCSDKNDPMGVLKASGEFVAICRAGDIWNKNNKLERQIRILESNASCSLVIHDVEFIKENGCPVDQDLRNRYIAYVGFDDRIYGLQHFQMLKTCGIIGTWMYRNILLNSREKEKYINSKLKPKLRLLIMLIANGKCQNILYDRFILCSLDEDKLNRSIFPKYDLLKVTYLLQETVEIKEFLLKNYDIKINVDYMILHIANGLLNYINDRIASKEELDKLVYLFEKVCNSEQIKNNRFGTAESNFFSLIQKKLLQYIVHSKNNKVSELIHCLSDLSEKSWITGIGNCVNSDVKNILYNRFKEIYPENQYYIVNGLKNNIMIYSLKMSKLCSKSIHKAGYLFKKIICFYLRKRRGFSGYMANEWYETVKGNLLRDKDTPLKVKLWCYRRGFMPWRIAQYGMDKNNFQEFLSDRDYMYIHQINNNYKKWIEDKMTLRLVLEPFKKYLPKYYYQIIQRDDRQIILPLSDLPNGYEASFDELFRLLRDKGKLSLKAASGTHGVGFYKMEYSNGGYYLNNKEVSEFDIRNVIKSFRSFYIVTEYINMHEDIKKIFVGSVNTIRVMMINRDGHHPQLMDAYMRIGTNKSGVTDNVAFGGVVCSVNMETGEFGNGLQLVNHSYVSIERHPDSGEFLHGVVPNWEYIKSKLLDMSKYLSQLEYLGFDVVCTQEGFVILEINSHQDLHRLPSYSQTVRDFFAYKLLRKEKRYKIKRI